MFMGSLNSYEEYPLVPRKIDRNFGITKFFLKYRRSIEREKEKRGEEAEEDEDEGKEKRSYKRVQMKRKEMKSSARYKRRYIVDARRFIRRCPFFSISRFVRK